MAGRYRKLPVEVEALQNTGQNLDECCEFLGGEAKRNINFLINYRTGVIRIHTLEGLMTSNPGSWIVKAQTGEYWPVQGAIFDQTYIEVPLQEEA
jgi:hypothetical protein